MPHECTNCGREFEDGSKEMLSGCPECGGTKFQFVPAIETSVAAGVSPSKGGADHKNPTETNRPHSRTGDGSRPWSPTGDPTDDEESLSGEFAEWPDSARRPEDRSDTDEPTSHTGDPTSGPGRSPASDGRPSSGSDEFLSENNESSSRESGAKTTRDVEATDSREGVDTDRDGENTAQADARSAVASPDELPETPERSSTPNDPEYGRVVSEPDDARPSLEELREELNDQFESIRIVSPGQYELNLMELYNREEYIVSLQEDGRYVIDVPESWREDSE